MDKTTIGKKYENLAVYHLKKKGYKILDRNFRCPASEIDIVAYDKQTKYIVFVEVKYRSSSKFGSPIEAITSEKARKIRVASQVYLKLKGWLDRNYRFDAVGILDEEIRHIINAF